MERCLLYSQPFLLSYIGLADRLNWQECDFPRLMYDKKNCRQKRAGLQLLKRCQDRISPEIRAGTKDTVDGSWHQRDVIMNISSSMYDHESDVVPVFAVQRLIGI